MQAQGLRLFLSLVRAGKYPNGPQHQLTAWQAWGCKGGQGAEAGKTEGLSQELGGRHIQELTRPGPPAPGALFLSRAWRSAVRAPRAWAPKPEVLTLLRESPQV